MLKEKGGESVYEWLHGLLADRKDGVLFSCFGLWHFGYIAAALIIAAVALRYLKDKPQETKETVMRRLVSVAFFLYVADFFLMPLAYGEIDIEKLPFHACTAMCVLCFLSYHNRFLEKLRPSLALLGFISNFVYLVYPAGVMWHGVHPLSYRVVQTLLFHGIMSVYGLLMLIFGPKEKRCGRDMAVVVGMTLWALLGSYVYSGQIEGYDRFFNWFFVVRDPFYMLPESIAPFVMPFLNVAVFFVAEMLIRWLVGKIRKVE